MKKDIKSYIIDGKKMEFDSSSFKVFFNSAKEKKGVSVVDYETELGVALSVSSSAIHNWRFGMNGPSDTETIKKLADYMELSDYKFFYLKKNREKKLCKLVKDRRIH